MRQLLILEPLQMLSCHTVVCEHVQSTKHDKEMHLHCNIDVPAAMYSKADVPYVKKVYPISFAQVQDRYMTSACRFVRCEPESISAVDTQILAMPVSLLMYLSHNFAV